VCTCPIVSCGDGIDPEHEALLADSVGLALLSVLEKLTPAERLAFVLHDMFAVPFDEIAPIVDRSPTAARQLASRARRRVQKQAPVPDAGTAPTAASREVHDAQAVAELALDFSQVARFSRPALVNGTAGPVTVPELFSVRGFTIKGGKIVEIDILADAARLAPLDLTVLDD
jgi:hypothetical protein